MNLGEDGYRSDDSADSVDSALTDYKPTGSSEIAEESTANNSNSFIY